MTWTTVLYCPRRVGRGNVGYGNIGDLEYGDIVD